MPFHRVWRSGLAVIGRLSRLLPLVALGATGGCFATRGDVRILQGDIAAMRTDVLKNQQEQRDALGQAYRALQVVSDSLAKVSARTVGMQGDSRGEMRSIREQLLQIQTLLGQSQATIARLRSEIEAARTAAPLAPATTGTVPPPPTASGASGARLPADSTASAAGTQPGPSQLYQSGRDLLNRGSNSTARAVFQELLTNYPTSDLAPEAQYFIAESLFKEKNWAAADPAYAAVVTTYPNSPKASLALYKRGQVAVSQGNTAQARQYFEQVIARYPRSDEAELAAETLKTLR
jgi:tol-pal system protein YbgF